MDVARPALTLSRRALVLRGTSANVPGWLLIGAIIATIMLLQLADPLAVDVASLATLAIASAALGSAAWFYTAVRPMPHFAAMATGIAQIILFSAVGSLLSYMVARYGGPLQDARFAAWDHMLGFDWLGYVRWFDAQGWPIAPLRIAYASLIPQVIAIVTVTGFTGRLVAMRRMLFAAMLSGTLIILLSPLMPAVSNFVALGLRPQDFEHLQPYAGLVHMADFNALRDGSFQLFSLRSAQGIITFPSYHAGLATVTAWGFSQTPWLRWPGLALAALTIVATPIDGGHYLVDILAGIACAALSISIAKACIR